MRNKEIEELDHRGNWTYYKSSYGFESWREYDENNKLIYFKNTNDFEYWLKYDENNQKIEITKQEFENIKIREYMSRTKCSRFELMEI